MKRLRLDLATFEFIAVTRVALGIGLGLLLARRLDRGHRTIAGVSLVALGAVSTIPAALAVRRGLRNSA